MVGDQQIDLTGHRLIGYGRGGIDCHEDGAHLTTRIAEDEAHGVPMFGQIRRKPGVELRHHVGQQHVGPAGLEPTTFPV